mmetsp:Transcript_677/g.1950  ORF Transcript_677/g.1950 Transcript_677/m.1950 type:complete len:166 (+) Transcript_677:47-544(+)
MQERVERNRASARVSNAKRKERDKSMKAEFSALNRTVQEHLLNITILRSENVALHQELEVSSSIQAPPAPTLAECSLDCFQVDELFTIDNLKYIPADALLLTSEVGLPIIRGKPDPAKNDLQFDWDDVEQFYSELSPVDGLHGSTPTTKLTEHESPSTTVSWAED